MKKFYVVSLVSAFFLFSVRTHAQIILTTPNGTYTQNFDEMGNTGTTLPAGWSLTRYAGSGTAAITLGVTNGGANSGGVYNVGTSGATERALGSLASGSTTPAFGASFTNKTGAVIGSFSLSGFSEQWRSASNSAVDETVVFEYSTDATSLNTGTWKELSNLNLVELLKTSTTAAAVDGNANRQSLAGSINSINLEVDKTIWIRWVDNDNSGSDGLYALDDFSVTWTNVAVANTVKVEAGANAMEPGTNGSFSVILNNPAPAGGVTVAYSLSGSAAAGSDYANAESGTVTIPAGAVSATLEMLVTDDAVAEPTENITITLNSITGGYSIAEGSATISVLDNESSTLYGFTFSGCTGELSDGFSQQSVTGDQVWSCTTFGRTGNAVQMNGFASSSQTNEDWLVSPALDLSGTTFPLLSFYSRSAFNGAPLQVFVTTNYTGDVTTTSWTQLGGMFPATGSDVWTLSQNINLGAYKQSAVRIAFRYVSTTAASSRWTLDDISILNSATPPAPSLTLENTILDFRQLTANDLSIGKPFTFSVNNPASGLTITAPSNFLLSKNNTTYSSSLTFSVSELSSGQKTVYAGFRPTAANTIYSGELSFTSTGIDSALVLLKGNTYPISSTLNVVNWNMEWFGGPQGPSNNDLQEENAKKALNALNADAFALVEIVDTARLGRLVRSLDESYAYVVSDYGSQAPTGTEPAYASAQKLAFVYKTSVVSNVSARGLMKSSGSAYSSWASGRFPFLVNTTVRKNGSSQNISFIVVHGKAGDTQSDYQSRLAGVTELKDTLDTYFANRNLVILGDLNDDLDNSIYTGGGRNLSSYDPLIKDSVDANHYKSPTLLLSQYGLASTVDFSDVIDHVIVSNEMFPNYLPLSASLYNDIQMVFDLPDFGNTTSDHYPVLTRFFVTGTAQAALPVKLTEFDATKEGGTVRISWKTAQEVNSKEFVIERSSNGVVFNNIGKKEAAGHSSSAKSYQFIDNNPFEGTTYYRLISVDLDRRTAISKVVRVDFGQKTSIALWPNPAKNKFTVSSPGGRFQLQIVDMSGRVVKTEQLNNQLETFSLAGLSKGIYLVRVQTSTGLFTDKLIIE